MKFLFTHRFFIIVSFIVLILFFIGFTWIKPGEMDLGGDSSRLYFYDPINYLKGQSLYSVSPSGLGGENFSYYGIPFFLFLAFLKIFLKSPTNLISLFYGGSLSLAFLFTYLSVRLVISEKGEKYSGNLTNLSSIIAGMFYIFSPSSILGWGHNILTFNQVFLNPLIFYLILKFLLTRRRLYLFSVLLLTVIFAANFSIVGAPPFFAFYPIAIIFLLLYVRTIRNLQIPWKDIILGTILFIGFQSFQLAPLIINLFIAKGAVYDQVFSNAAKFQRGFDYFAANAEGVSVTLNWMHLPQHTPLRSINFAFILFPLIFLLGFVWNKGKTLLLIGFFYLIAFFWMSAKITDLGFNFYKSLFAIPGFAMFRNFYGQWGYLYLFFYVLLLAKSLSIVLEKVSRFVFPLLLFIVLALIITAWPLINGSLVDTYHWTSNNVKIAFKMDPQYEKVLNYFRKSISFGKVFLLPLPDHGYQLIGGIDKGTAYVGPSTISYLASKQDFSSYDELGKYSDLIIKTGRTKNYDIFVKALGLLGVKYVFYNNDPNIYGSPFPSFPYSYVKANLPPDQEEYKKFVDNLKLKQVLAVNNKYYIYQQDEKNYLPEVYATNNTVFFDRVIDDWFVPLSLESIDKNRAAIFEGGNSSNMGSVFYEAKPSNNFDSITKNQYPPLVLHNSFASVPPKSFYYPVIVIREELAMNKDLKTNRDDYIDRRLFYSAKRVIEIEKYGKNMNVAITSTDPEKLYSDFSSLDKFIVKPSLINSLNWSLARYYRYLRESIDAVNSSSEDSEWKIHQKFLINEYLLQHRLRLSKYLRGSENNQNQTDYLFDLVDNIFYELTNRLNYPKITDNEMVYVLNLPKSENHKYTLFLGNNNLKNSDITVDIDSNKLNQKDAQHGLYWDNFGQISIDSSGSGKKLLKLTKNNSINLIDTADRIFLETIQDTKNYKALEIDTTLFKGQTGIFWKLNDWQPNSYYLISFDYRSSINPFQIKLIDSDVDSSNNRNFNVIVDDSLVSKRWVHYQSLIKTGKFSDSAILASVTYPYEAKDSKFEVQNMSIRQIPVTKVLLHLADKVTDDNSNESPKLTFSKISPVKYSVHIKQGDKPYYLVLSEWFNKDWKIYPTEKENFAGNYLWFNKKTIGEKEHYLVNGFANAWYIKPDSFTGKDEYDLTIEMVSQRNFYVASIVSLITLVVFIPIFIRSLWQRN